MEKLENLSNCEDFIYLAKVAEKAERYNEMRNFVKIFCSKKESSLNIEERNLLSVAYKNSVGSYRASVRVLKSLVVPTNSENERVHLESFIQKQKLELRNICVEVLDIISLFISSSDFDLCLFLSKSKCDYLRYLCEFPINEEERKFYNEEFIKAEEELNVRINELPPTSVIKLSYFLNRSFAEFQFNNDREKAIEIAEKAFNAAIEAIDELDEEDYKESTLVMQLLKDNIVSWKER